MQNITTETDMLCPICGGALFRLKCSTFMPIMDCNMIFVCDEDKNHRFWKHPFESDDILHLNKNASFTNFKSEKDYNIIRK